eukprot:Skav218776  [mRNA]  locus=scaffold1372:387424:393293:- [translate_table: standard]
MKTKSGTPYYARHSRHSGGTQMAMDGHGWPWDAMGCHGMPWDAMGCHGFQCRRLSIGPQVSDDAKQLIKKLLEMKPADRYTAEQAARCGQALNHIWIKEKAPHSSKEPLNTTSVAQPQPELAHPVAAWDAPWFLALDSNGDGMLSIKEISHWSALIGPSSTETTLEGSEGREGREGRESSELEGDGLKAAGMKDNDLSGSIEYKDSISITYKRMRCGLPSASSTGMVMVWALGHGTRPALPWRPWGCTAARGKICMDELRHVLQDGSGALGGCEIAEGGLWSAFCVFDRNGDGLGPGPWHQARPALATLGMHCGSRQDLHGRAETRSARWQRSPRRLRDREGRLR